MVGDVIHGRGLSTINGNNRLDNSERMTEKNIVMRKKQSDRDTERKKVERTIEEGGKKLIKRSNSF